MRGIPLASYTRVLLRAMVCARVPVAREHTPILPNDAARTMDAPCCSMTNKSRTLFPARARWVSDGSRQS
eukprot:2452560-Prymnesium_polylepis.1